METKEQLVANIKEWIKMDTEISNFKKEIKERNDKKKAVTDDLRKAMKSNSIDAFEINGGALVFKKCKSKKPINAKTLLAALQTFYKEDSKTAEDLTKHILESREEQIKETIKRKINK
jgi:hypothetical protein